MLPHYSHGALVALFMLSVGLIGLFSAMMLRSKAKVYWHFVYYTCLTLLVSSGCLCPSYCGAHFCLCAVMLFGMIMLAVTDIGESAEPFLSHADR